MNRRYVAAHAIGSVPFSGVWLAGISLPAGPADWRLVAASSIPQVVVAISLVLQYVGEQLDEAPAPPPRRRPSPHPRRALPVGQSEVAR